MNYLGHIFLSFDNPEFAMMNLYGDFFKGGNTSDQKVNVTKGILYHREIDRYIDTHPVVKELLPTLRKKLPKVASVAVDLFFDHLLAKHWSNFHSDALPDFLQRHYLVFTKGNSDLSHEFNQYLKILVKKDWIGQYSSELGLDRLCKGVSSRISFPNQLTQGLQVFKEHEIEIEKAFYEYMKDAIAHFKIIYLKYFP